MSVYEAIWWLQTLYWALKFHILILVWFMSRINRSSPLKSNNRLLPD